jgi:hypothetical protein
MADKLEMASAHDRGRVSDAIARSPLVSCQQPSDRPNRESGGVANQAPLLVHCLHAAAPLVARSEIDGRLATQSPLNVPPWAPAGSRASLRPEAELSSAAMPVPETALASCEEQSALARLCGRGRAFLPGRRIERDPGGVRGAQLPASQGVNLHEILHMPSSRPAVGEDRGTRCGRRPLGRIAVRARRSVNRSREPVS